MICAVKFIDILPEADPHLGVLGRRNPIKILVFDDSETNRAAAQAQLKDHDLTVVGTYDEAALLLVPHYAESYGRYKPDFDAVLTDLLVPASGKRQHSEGLSYVGQEMPVGIFIGLQAAVRARAKYVGVITDANHHLHPASAALEPIHREEDHSLQRIFRVEDSQFALCGDWLVKNFHPQDFSVPLRWGEEVPGMIRAKHWAGLLDILLGAG